MDTSHMIILASSIITTIVSGIVGAISYRDRVKTDTNANEEINKYKNVVKRVDSLEAEQKADRAWQTRHDSEQLAKMRVILINELKRCIKQKYKTDVDIELIEPLLQIYFSKPYTGNGVVKSYDKIYQTLPFKQDSLLEQSK